MSKQEAERLAAVLDAGENFYAESSLWFDHQLSGAVDEAATLLRQWPEDQSARIAELEAAHRSLVSKFHHAVKDAGWHPGRTDDDLCDIIRAKGATMKVLEDELALRRKSGSASDRLHNICQAISEESDGSAFSREEWGRIDQENTALRAQRDALLEALEVAKQGLQWYRDMHPNEVDGSDAEADELIDAAIKAAGGLT